MTEIIDLLSSSPPLARAQRPAKGVPTTALLDKGVFSLDSDNLSILDQPDFPIEQLEKRRKLSPLTTIRREHEQVTTNAIFELSSEPNTPPDLPEAPKKLHNPLLKEPVFDIDHSDVFRFSSSAPEPLHQATTIEPPPILELSSDRDDAVEDPIETSSQPAAASKPLFSRRTADLLAGLSSTSHMDSHKHPSKSRGKAKRSESVDITVNTTAKFKRATKPSTTKQDDIIDSSQPAATTNKNGGGVSAQTDGHMAREKASKTTAKADRDAQKEADRKRKLLEKEAKAKEKQRAADIAEVNRSKTNKKTTAPEMIVDMPASLQGLSVGNQIEELMRQLDVQVTFSEDEVDLTDDVEISVGNIIQWRRKVVADYDEDLELWKPLAQPRISRENFVLVHMKAEEFVTVAAVGGSHQAKPTAATSESSMKANIDTYVQSLRGRYPSCTLICLIEGLSAWHRKSQTAKNRAYTAAVRSQVLDDDTREPRDTSTVTTQSPPPPGQLSRHSDTSNNNNNIAKKPSKRTGGKANKPPALDLSSVTPGLTETLLLHLQLHHQPLLIHHTSSAATTAAQIASFTTHLSTRPYRLASQAHNLASASFCMATGQIRTGATPHETYVNMLQEVNRVTPSMAYGVSGAGHDSVGKLVRAFRAHGNLVLQDVRKSVNRDGAWSDRRLGPMVSRRLAKVFLATDPAMRDGIA